MLLARTLCFAIFIFIFGYFVFFDYRVVTRGTNTGTPSSTGTPVLSASKSYLLDSNRNRQRTPNNSTPAQNQGTLSLAISGITIGGSNPTAFAQTNTCGASLASGLSCTLSVTFTPIAAATYTATISIADNAAGSPQTITVTGTGGSATTAQAVLSPGTLTFGTTVNTTTVLRQTITLSNPGTAPLTISGIAITGTGASALFVGVGTCYSSDLFRCQCELHNLHYLAPTSATTFAAGIVITDNAATGSTQTASLNGTGTLALAPQVTLTPASLTFSTTPSTASSSQTMVLSNSGTDVLTISNIALTGTAVADFSQSNNCPTSLAVGATCNISVIFNAPANRRHQYRRALTHLQDKRSRLPTIGPSLSGTGTTTATPPDSSTFTPASLSFTTSVGSTSAPEIIMLSNPGNSALAISNIALTGANASSFSHEPTPALQRSLSTQPALSP